ncbi:MAG TPA: sodium-dependent transporter [Methanomicrobia archaeon]|nr:sodium-dependent transporter [Methanomicrobia archaeon]
MPREHWGSQLGFLLAAIGSALGLGNVWRFPYVAGQNGGGAFLIPYILSLLLFGIPLAVLEFAVGRHFKRSIVTAMRFIRRELIWIGIGAVLVSTIVLSYYLVITGWTLAFFLFAVTNIDLVFENFIQTYLSPGFFIIVVLIMAMIVVKGIRGGIESANKVLVPAFILLLAFMIVYALMLPNARAGISFYLTPDFAKLADFSVWIAAFGQAFFSLGVGFGILLTYGSYLEEDISLISNAGIIALSDLLIAFSSGLLIFPIVFSFGFEPTAGVSLAFITLPLIFAQISYGAVLAAIFFLLLFFAALTSAISLLEVGVTALVDETALSRFRATALLSGIVLVLGLPAALSYSGLNLQLFNMPVLDLVDQFFGTLCIILSALLIAIAVTWFFKKQVIETEMNRNARWTLGDLLFPLIKYVIPLVLLLVFIAEIAAYFS